MDAKELCIVYISQWKKNLYVNLVADFNGSFAAKQITANRQLCLLSILMNFVHFNSNAKSEFPTHKKCPKGFHKHWFAFNSVKYTICGWV